MSEYKNIIIETYLNIGEASNKPIRAHPCRGQGFDHKLNIECSADMRESFPVGSLFLVKVKVTEREGVPFLYRHYRWDYKQISHEDAEQYIKENFK